MAGREIPVQVVINGRDNSGPAFTSLSGALNRVGEIAMGIVTGKILVKLGQAITDNIGKGLEASRDFETAMADVSTLIAGDSTAAIKKLGDGISDMVSRVPKSANELGSAAYQILSAGITDTNKALSVLEASARLATAGLGTTDEAVNLMSGALNAFKSQNISSEAAANIFFKTVRSGKTTIAELSTGFGQVGPVAATLKIHLDELQAATAALTTANVPTSVAQTQLRAAMSSLIKPSTDMTDLFKKLGVSSGEAAIKQFGFVGTMYKLTQAAHGNNEVIAKAFGSVEALGAVLSLTGEQGSTFTDILKGMRDGTDNLTEAFDKQMKTSANIGAVIDNKVTAKLRQLGDVINPVINQLKLMGLELGEKLLSNIPKVANAIGDLINKFLTTTPVGQAIATIFQAISSAAQSIAQFISEKLSVAWASIQEALSKSGPTFDSIGRSLGNIGTIAGTYLGPILQKLGEVIGQIWETVLKPLIDWLATNAGPILDAVLKFIALGLVGISKAFEMAAPIINSILNFISTAFQNIANVTSSVFSGMRNIVSGAWNALSGIIKGAINTIIDVINSFIRHFNAALQVIDSAGSVIGIHVSFRVGEIPRLFRGGTLRTNGPTLFVAGDNPGGVEEVSVKPVQGAAKNSPNGGDGASSNIVINVSGSIMSENDLLETVINGIKNMSRMEGKDPSEFLNFNGRP